MPWQLAALAAAVLASHATLRRDRAQRVWQSDVSVRALRLSTVRPAGSITARVIVAADSDDARAVRLEIILPIGVGVLDMPAICRSSPSPIMSLTARVSCALGDVRARQPRTISITTTGRPTSHMPLRFAVFAFSDTPDPRPANNFADGSFPARQGAP